MMTDKRKESIKKAIEDIAYYCKEHRCNKCEIYTFCFEHFQDTPMANWDVDIDKLFKDE